VVDRFEQRHHVHVICSALDGQSALADRRDTLLDVEDRGDPRTAPEPVHASDRDNEPVELSAVEFAQARIHIPAHTDELKIGT
jgi:hypothetical protein